MDYTADIPQRQQELAELGRRRMERKRQQLMDENDKREKNSMATEDVRMIAQRQQELADAAAARAEEGVVKRLDADRDARHAGVDELAQPRGVKGARVHLERRLGVVGEAELGADGFDGLREQRRRRERRRAAAKVQGAERR